jgi:carbonic anhydrase/acetyltransferase-like protein (isoleucine patch superfamily)
MRLIPFGNHTPQVASSAFVADTATVIGDATLHQNSVVMFGAILRGDRETISLGEGSNLQDNVVVHADPGFKTTIGSGVSVGHQATVHGATVEDDVLIGMGAILLNGCHICSGSIIAAGSVVREGEVVPPRSLVAGAPGTVKRSTTDEEVVAIKANARTYQELAASYQANAG